MRGIIVLFVVLIFGVSCYGQAADKEIEAGILKCKLRDYRGALIIFNQAVKNDPTSFAAYYYRGVAKIELRDYKSATQDFNKAIELNPKKSEAYYERGFARRKMGDYAGSKADFDTAKKIDPASSQFDFREGHRPSFKLSDTISYSTLNRMTREKFLSKYAIPDSLDVFDKRGFDLYSFFYFHEHDTCWIYFHGNKLQTILYLNGSDRWHVIEY